MLRILAVEHTDHDQPVEERVSGDPYFRWRCVGRSRFNTRPQLHWCHGTSGQGFTIAPRLAGQRHQYIENQLLSFNRHTRDNPLSQQYMWGAAANLSTQTANELAAYFSTLPAKPDDDGHPDLVTLGRSIYEQGIPEANIVSCLVCHGPNAEGVGEIPRLGGLAYPYLERRLQQWTEAYHTTAWPMPRVARSLSQHHVDALASYLSFVR
jgi:cytochrome c553